MIRELRDQGAHAALCFVVVAGLRLLGVDLTFYQGAFLGLCLWADREITEWQNAAPGKGKPWSRGSLIDLSGWLLGGVLGGLL
jgi:hypothetical protein